MGQPGQQARGIPRSPHQRELPPSLEPGLWAGDQPQASRKREPAPPELFGVPLPKVPVPGGQFEQEGPARACELVWVQALSGTGLEAKVEALEPSAKRCMVARLNETCASAFATMFDGAREEGVTVLPYRPYRAETERVAKEFARQACAGVRETPEFRRLLEALRGRLNDFLEE